MLTHDIKRDGVTYEISCNDAADTSLSRLTEVLDLALRSGQDFNNSHVCRFPRPTANQESGQLELWNDEYYDSYFVETISKDITGE